MSSEKVVQITARLAEAPPLETRRWSYDDCGHHHVELDPVLRVVNCRDCGTERLDPFEHLLYLSGEWRHWARQIERLRELEVGYANRERDKWVRRRDRHLRAHPDHKLDFDKTSWSRSSGECQECWRLVTSGGLYFQPRDVKPPVPPAGDVAS